MSQLTSRPAGSDRVDVGDEPALDPDTTFTILKNPRRRHVIRCLEDLGGESSVRELTAEVAARENDCAVADLDYDQRKTVYTSLYQTHLDRMDEAGVVDYDQRSGQVRLTDAVEELDVHLAVADGGQAAGATVSRSSRWPVAYPVVAAANLLLVGALLAAGAAAVGTTLAAATGVTAVLLAALASYQWYRADGVVDPFDRRPD